MPTKPHRTLTPLALAVLELLHEQSMHPYEIQQTIRDRFTDHVVKVRAGSLYHTMEVLQRRGLVEPVETGRAGRRPERTIYAITEAGRDEFRGNLRDLLRSPQHEYPVFGAAIEMLHMLDKDDAIELLTTRMIALEAQAASYEQISAGLFKRGIPRLMTIEVDYVQAMCVAELAWVRKLIENVRSAVLPWASREHEERHEGRDEKEHQP